jgi:hypothetical protein
MSERPHKELVTLVKRTRTLMWRQRLLQSLWYSSAVVSIGLLLAAAVHIRVAVVPASVWLPLALAPLALVTLYVLLWQRPSLAAAAAQLDRLGEYHNLLNTAWEVLGTPPERRLAGAHIVLCQARDLSARIAVPVSQLTSSSWQGRYGVGPWAVISIAVFALQLQVQQPVGVVLSAGTAGYLAADADWRRASELAENSPPADGQSPVFQSRGQQDMRPDSISALAGGQPPPDAALEGGLASDALRPGSSGTRKLGDASVGNETPKAIESVGGEHEFGAEKSFPGIDESGEIVTLGLQFEGFSRSTTTPNSTIAGAGSVSLGTAHARALDKRAIPGKSIARAGVAAAYNNHFSLAQRLQIRAYFDHLED